jgi:hypothetical protein
MSSKINIIEIVTGHFDTLRESDGKRSKSDLVTFFVFPFFIGFVSALSGFNLDTNLSSLLVNFGSIFTALLLSVLVLVYDQETKLNDRSKSDAFFDLKKELLSQLYYNISFSILCSVALVLLCFFHSVIAGVHTNINIGKYAVTIKYDVYIVTPVVVFFAANLFLNILMIVKRMHTLLVSR